MSAPSNYEQYLLELINHARMNPAAEAARLNIGLNSGLSAGTISNTSKQPLAFNSNLNDAAAGHSRWMLDVDRFSHTGRGGSDPGDRMEDAGYRFTGSWTWGENIAWNGTTGNLNIRSSLKSANDGLFKSAGHRVNTLEDDFKEIGLGIEIGKFTSGNTYNAFMLTENFAKSGAGNFVTGVAYRDKNGDDFYSIGEGRSGVRVTVLQDGQVLEAANVWGSGGYSLKTSASGDLKIKFAGGGLAKPVVVDAEMSGENIKVDLVGSAHIVASTDINLRSNAKSAELLGLDGLSATGNQLSNVISGNAAANRIIGGKGHDTLNGFAGDDRLFGGVGSDRLDGGAGSDVLNGAAGNDVAFGGAGADKIIGGGGIDRLNGGSGNDWFRGGADRDIFIFAEGADRDVVKDFTPGTDRINLRAFDFASVTEVLNLATQTSRGTVFDFGDGDRLTLLSTAKSDLDATDFIV